MTRVSIQTPLPTVATIGLERGKLHLSFEIDVAAEVGRAVLEGRAPSLDGELAEAVIAALRALWMARAMPQGSA